MNYALAAGVRRTLYGEDKGGTETRGQVSGEDEDGTMATQYSDNTMTRPTTLTARLANRQAAKAHTQASAQLKEITSAANTTVQRTGTEHCHTTLAM